MLVDGVEGAGQQLAGFAVDLADRIFECRDRFVGAGVPEPLALQAGGFESLLAALDIVEIANETQCSIDDIAATYAMVGDRLELDWLRDRIVGDGVQPDIEEIPIVRKPPQPSEAK